MSTHQSLHAFIGNQVRHIRKPLSIDNELIEILKENRDRGGQLKQTQFIRVLQSLNSKLSIHYHQFYSKQSITQLCDQIDQLRSEELEEQSDFIERFKNLETPVDLNSEYKLYSLEQVLKQLEELPNVKTELNEDENDPYVQYNIKKNEISKKIKKIRRLQKKKKLIQIYTELLKLQIGDRRSIQENLPNSKSSLFDEIAKLRIVLEKLNNLDDARTKNLKQQTITS